MGSSNKDLDQLCINTIRTLSMDAVEQANSGHPGTPMAMAPVAYCLWQRFLRYDPSDPTWPNRDRFVLSAGHASMLLYSLLHLTGVRDAGAERNGERPAVSLDDIERFRQLGSRCPGHPEYGETTGVEATTGPLGQGVGMSVGMAIAGRWLAERYNQPDATLFDHDVYALASDGDMMEGLSGEAASLAGHLSLSNLCWIYDNNGITIDGTTELTFSEDIARRFAGYGWAVEHVEDANDLDGLTAALEGFGRGREGRRGPLFIIVDSHIAYGAPGKQDTSEAHGAPLGEEEVSLAKRDYGWDEHARFLVPEGVREHFAAGMGERGRALRMRWDETLLDYRGAHPDLAEELDVIRDGGLPDAWDRSMPAPDAFAEPVAGRVVSSGALNALARNVPWILGGSADLASSNKTVLTFDGADDLSSTAPGGRNIRFGIREHAMAATSNGLALSGLRPFASTFLVFSDYARPAMRLSALMGLNVVYVFTHDSISLGEDGPTHQPVEHLASLRAMPGMTVVRPADAAEVLDAWRVIMSGVDGPAALVLSRQKLAPIDRARYAASRVGKGAYVLADSAETPDVILIGTGSEVSLCVAASERLAQKGIPSRVVSMPSWELFERQSDEYRESVLPSAVCARVSVEQGSTLGWERYTGAAGRRIGIDTFGASAPMRDLHEHFGFTVEAVVDAARRQLARIDG